MKQIASGRHLLTKVRGEGQSGQSDLLD